MTRIEKLENLFVKSSLCNLFRIRKRDDREGFSCLRFETNQYRIFSIEIWDTNKEGEFFRIYYSHDLPEELKSEFNQLEGRFGSKSTCSDFKGDFEKVAQSLYGIISSDSTIELLQKNPVLSRDSYYEGLELPDIDTSDEEIMGRVFSWKELLAINEDTSEDNKLKQALSQCGVYLQRSIDGKSRYVGSAYNNGGILARWIKHLTSNGHAKHLNLFVLENGYNNICFTVLEITRKEDALNAETRWKTILGSKNSGSYDGFRRNSN